MDQAVCREHRLPSAHHSAYTSFRLLVRFLPVTKYRRNGYKFLCKFVQDRLDGKLDENGEKPEDLVQWLIDAAPPVERNAVAVSERVMALNVASIHTTTMVSAPSQRTIT